VTQASIDALSRAHADGARVVIVTGRNLPMARASVSDLPMPLTFIAHNGAATMDTAGCVTTRHLRRETAATICQAFQDADCEPFVYVADGSACRLLHRPPDNPALARYIAANVSVCEPVVDVMASVDGACVLHVVAIEASGRVRRALRTLPRFPDARLMTSGGLYGGEYWFLEAIHPESSKVNALETVVRRWDLSLEDVLAVGDNLNDKQMLEAVGRGVAMGNAPDEVKAVADHVTASNDDEGVALALAHAMGV